MSISFQAFITLLVMSPLLLIGYLAVLHALSKRYQSAKRREHILFCERCNSIYTLDERHPERGCPFCDDASSY